MSDYRDKINSHLDQLVQMGVLDEVQPGKYRKTVDFRNAVKAAVQVMYQNSRYDELWTDPVKVRNTAETLALHTMTTVPISESEAIEMISILITMGQLNNQ